MDSHWIETEIMCPYCSDAYISGRCKRVDENTILCLRCKASYPIIDGIPIAVIGYDLHLQEMEKRIEEDPGWFSKSQVEYYKKGPYRNHLQKRRQYVSGIIKQFLHKISINELLQPLRILDLGCGDGQNLEWLIKFIKINSKAIQLYATDYNLLRLRRTKNAFPDIKITLMDIHHPVFRKGYFHIIFCNHVLEHVSNPTFALLKSSFMLNDNGIIIIGVPNEGSLWWQLAYKLEPEVRKATDHKHFFTMSQLVEMTQKVELSIIEEKYMGYGLPHFTADSVLKGSVAGIDDLMEELGQKFFKDQASSIYIICKKEVNNGK